VASSVSPLVDQELPCAWGPWKSRPRRTPRRLAFRGRLKVSDHFMLGLAMNGIRPGGSWAGTSG
jgi:hypothetical protein